MIGIHDCQIAATALVHRLTVVTDNVAEFRRVPGLKVIKKFLAIKKKREGKKEEASK